MLDAVRLAEEGTDAAIISRHERLYLAWTGDDYHLNLAWSPDARQILDKLRLDQQSSTLQDDSTPSSGTTASRWPAPPALAATAEHLYLAWSSGWQAGWLTVMADPSCYINLLADPEDPLSAPVCLKEARSPIPPALCSHQDSLILAWAGTDRHINILADPETPHGAPVRLEEAKGIPALCSHQDRLILAWTGTDGHLNLARLQQLEALLQAEQATVAARRTGAAGP